MITRKVALCMFIGGWMGFALGVSGYSFSSWEYWVFMIPLWIALGFI